MRKVLSTSTAQPSRYRPHSRTRAQPGSTDHTGSGSGRHCHSISATARVAASTYVLRSIDGGTIRVHRRLNHGRAITLCCAANSPSSAPSTTNANQTGPASPSSTPVGTPTPARNPIA
jgi:hypothetical protein